MRIAGLNSKPINIEPTWFWFSYYVGVVVGFVLTLSSYGFMACLLTFFVTSSRATKFRSKTKKQLEPDFKEGKVFQ